MADVFPYRSPSSASSRSCLEDCARRRHNPLLHPRAAGAQTRPAPESMASNKAHNASVTLLSSRSFSHRVGAELRESLSKIASLVVVFGPIFFPLLKGGQEGFGSD